MTELIYTCSKEEDISLQCTKYDHWLSSEVLKTDDTTSYSNVWSFSIQYTTYDRWLAPEVLKTGDTTLHSDVWSFGATLYEIYTQGIKPLNIEYLFIFQTALLKLSPSMKLVL